MSSSEGIAEWIPLGDLDDYLLVEDVKMILDKIHRKKPDDPPFSGRSFYSVEGRLVLVFN